MDSDSAGTTKDTQGATVVITHRVRPDRHADYERLISDIAPHCKAAPGHLDWHVVRPIAGLTETFTVVIRFDTEAHLRAWMKSDERAQRIANAQSQSLLVDGDAFFISSGLDFWFTPAGAKAQVPVRWKQYLVTWSAIYPLAFGIPMLVAPLLHQLGAPDALWLTMLVSTGVVVFMMVYVVMPRYTRLLRRWLFA